MTTNEPGKPSRRKTTREAAEQLGLSSAQFRRLANKLSMEPSGYDLNPHNPSMPAYLWDPVMIGQLADHAEVQSLKTASPRRQEAAAKAAATRQAQTEQLVAAVQVQVPLFNEADLFLRACGHYNSRQTYWRATGGAAMPESCPRDMLVRLAVEYLRDVLTDDCLAQAQVSGRPGAAAARREIMAKVLRAITEHYPDLADECLKQQRHMMEERN